MIERKYKSKSEYEYRLKLQREANKNSVKCPTRDNIINCSECQHECKLRMITKDINAIEVPPESQPEIYY